MVDYTDVVGKPFEPTILVYGDDAEWLCMVDEMGSTLYDFKEGDSLLVDNRGMILLCYSEAHGDFPPEEVPEEHLILKVMKKVE